MYKYLNPKNYFQYFLNGFAKLASIALQPAENYLAQKHGDEGIKKYPPVFIIGAPRTGSTIFYQVITNCWDIGYINNLEYLFYRNIIFGGLLSQKIFKNKCHNNFKANHGATKGYNSPSEFGSFWYRWFPSATHFVGADELTELQKREMRRVVSAMIALKGKPLFFKNMNCGQRIGALSQIFPEALFIYCARNPLYTAQSLLETRKRVYGNYNTWWSIMPKEYHKLQSLQPIEQVVAQIYYIEKQINKDLEKYYSGKWIELKYEHFAENPLQQLQAIRSFLDTHGITVSQKSDQRLDFINNMNKITINLATITELKEHINRYFH